MNHDTLMRDLARLKLSARLMITVREQYRADIIDLTRRKDVFRALGQPGKAGLAEATIAKIKVEIVNVEFALIEDGQRLMSLCAAIDEAGVPRERILNVLGVNTSEWNTPEVAKYGDKAIHLVAVLDPRWPGQTPPPVASANWARQGRMDYADSRLMARRLAASLSR